MPPKNNNEVNESSNSNGNMTDLHSNPYYASQHTRSLSDISVGEILVKYQDDSQLLNHILVAKAQEDKRRTAEELRQAEEARLQTKFIEFELTQSRQDNSFGQSNNSSNTPSIFTSSFVDQHDQFSDHSSSLQAGMDTSPLPMTTSEFHYIAQQQQQQQQQENVSIASSSPSIDFISPSNFDLYGNDHMMLSSSPPQVDDLPLFLTTTASIENSATTTNTIATAITVVKSTTNNNKGKQKKTTNSSPPKNIHRTLSYESVMTLSDLNMNRPHSVSPPPVPQPPLDHDKVMEALRAKLRKSTSPYQHSSRPKPSPEPIPPPNTYPTTGVLLLNLKSRRRKSSVTKRSSSKP